MTYKKNAHLDDTTTLNKGASAALIEEDERRSPAN